MGGYDLVLFDFDGTLHDSFESIALSYQYALFATKSMVIDDLQRFRPCIGPPIADSFAMFGVRPDEVADCFRHYRDFFNRRGYTYCKPYPGVTEMLERLRAAGIKIAIASSKGISVITMLLEKDGLTPLFDYISAQSDEEHAHHESKTSLIERAMRALDAQPERTVMVGDRHFDAEGARGAGVDFIAADYGFAEPDEFDAYPVALHAESVADIAAFVLGD